MAPKTQIAGEEEPPAKVAKTSHEGVADELEKDALKDARPRIAETVGMVTEDSTLNVIPTSGGKVLMGLSDAGLQFLVAASRANVGVKSGRYMFEVRVVEVLLPTMPGGRMAPLQPISRQQCRVGFSKKGSSLFLGETEDSVCFDSDGCFINNKHKTNVAERFVRDNVFGVLLNLDPASPNANTISLFKDGRRVSKPQPLPEGLVGHALFPHVSFRNVTLQVHFGPGLIAPVPFECCTIQEAAKEDAVIASSSCSQDGKFEILFPIALPDEGTFDWLDDFLENHPGYTEVSDRKIVEWATGSGLGKPRTTSLKNSNDKPDVTFGIQALDEMTPRKLLYTIAPLIPRNYVVMEVKSNLLKSERQDLLHRFDLPHFRRVAAVVVGEPPESFKVKVRAAVLAEKQERRRQMEMQQKLVREKMEKQKAMEEAQMKMFEATKAEGAEAKDEEVKTEEVKEEGVKEEPDVEMKEEPQEEEQPPVAELDEEEQKLWFLPRPVTDMVAPVFNSTFADFTLPTDEENFTEIRYEWATELASKEYMRSWMQAKKITSRVEDLVPSEWFNARVGDWSKLSNEWQVKQKDFKADPLRQQAAELRADKEKRYHQKQEREKSKEAGSAEGEAEAEAEATADAELEGFVPPDVFTVDVNDIGEGEPLFANFTFEDWALMNLRFEISLLMQFFRQEVTDPERPGIHESHVGYYYNRCFRKALNPKLFGVTTAAEVCDFIKDVVTVLDNGILSPVLTEEQTADLEKLLRLTEEARRERQQRLEGGDESCRLKFSAIMQQQMTQSHQPSWGGKGGPMPKSGGWPGAAQWPGGQPVAARPGFVPRPNMPPGLAARGWGPSYGWAGGYQGW
ncbi:unnamed protein product [Cladocopium goreaui]|uniref:B30.2/SPRY domain-containing protein n=1 Tax=Cladocopium goreaui TaxID=2562237 RepID=A0A9P1FRN0_9DINO|nr:unnamed protein product [Cladocopium goreaui]